MADETRDTRSQLRQPLTLSILALAAVGWAVALGAWITGNSAQERLVVELGTVREAETDVRARFAEQVETTGTLDEVTASLDESRSEFERVTAERAEVEASLATLRDEFETTSEQLDAARAEVDRLTAEAEPLKATIAEFDSESAEAQARVEEGRQELSAIGQRLEEARGQEAELQSTVSELSDEAARVSQVAASAAAEAQEARETEASMRERTEKAQDEVARLEGERESLNAAVADLTSRRDGLVESVAALTEQRGELQSMVVTLTAMLSSRSERLQEVERTIAAASGDGSGTSGSEGMVIDGSGKPVVAEIDAGIVDASVDDQDAPAGESEGQTSATAPYEDGKGTETAEAANAGEAEATTEPDGRETESSANESADGAEEAQTAGSNGPEAAPLETLEPGVYKADVFMVTFSHDSEFNIIDTEKNLQVHGDYEVGDGTLTLRRDQGDEGMGSYPMTCSISMNDEGVRIDGADGECGLLSGLVLVAAE